MSKDYSILLIEDNDSDASLIKLALSKTSTGSIHIRRSSNLTDGLKKIVDSSFDAVITTLDLSDSTGLDTVRRLVQAATSVPVIVLGGSSDEELGLRVVSEGAQDCVYKESIENVDFIQKVYFAIERQKRLNQLNESMERLSESAEFKGRFLTQMSHEIRTPLSGIVGSASILNEIKLDGEAGELVESIRQNGDLLLGIINDILDLSKFEAGHINLRPQKFRIRKIVSEVIDSFSNAADRNNVIITDLFSPDIERYVFLDPNRFKQILNNLLGNAVKYTDSGYVCICINKCIGGSENKLKIEVKDSGKGISEEKQIGLFDAFRQVSYEDQFKGTGLGLAICSQLVASMGGEIGIQSDVGIGSVFWFTVDCEFIRGVYSDRSNLDGKHIVVLGKVERYNDILKEQFLNRGVEMTFVKEISEVNEISKKRVIDLFIFNSHTLGKEILNLWLKDLSDDYFHIPQLILSSRQQIKNVDAKNDVCSRLVLLYPLHQSKLFSTAASLMCEEYAVKHEIKQSVGLKKRSGKSGNILIVDDVRSNTQIVEKMLTILGCKYKTVFDGVDAVACCDVEKFDLILMDCQMPVMSGVEATKVIKKRNSLNCNTPIVALTANAFPSDNEACLESGMDGFLTKPMKLEELSEMLGQFLDCEPFYANKFPSESGVVFQTVLNVETLEMLKKLEYPGDEASFLDDLIETYQSETPEIVVQLQEGLLKNDFRKIEHYSHKLKGFSRNLGANMLADICESIEVNQLTLSLNERKNLCERVSQLHRHSIDELNKNWKRKLAA